MYCPSKLLKWLVPHYYSQVAKNKWFSPTISKQETKYLAGLFGFWQNHIPPLQTLLHAILPCGWCSHHKWGRWCKTFFIHAKHMYIWIFALKGNFLWLELIGFSVFVSYKNEAPDVENLQLSCSADGTVKGTAALTNSLAVSQNVKHRVLMWPCSYIPRQRPKRNESICPHKIRKGMFVAKACISIKFLKSHL